MKPKNTLRITAKSENDQNYQETMCSSEHRLGATQNPSKWNFTWEAQSHIPTLRLYVFNPYIKPAAQCIRLRVDTVFEQSLLTVSFFETESQVDTSLRVPIPRVVIDFESPVHLRTLDDHIEVKLALLLPVDHPLGSNFDSVLNALENDECNGEILAQNGADALSACSEIVCCGGSELLLQKLLNNVDQGYQVCNIKGLHIAILYLLCRVFKEMPSVHWRDVADNWFGTCCCSFGGISEKMVLNYAKSYCCATGLCLISTTSVIISTDDLLECKLPERNKLKYDSDLNSDDISYLNKLTLGNENDQQKNVSCENICEGVQGIDKDHYVNCCSLDSCEDLLGQHESVVDLELPENQKIFLNGYLGDVFMARPSNLSKDIEWIEFFCPKCSCLLGAYPSHNDRVPLDGGVRLYKFYISTSLPAKGAYDLFRNYSFERMFTSQLLESANDELSFRTVVRDMRNKYHSLQIVLLNPNAWSYAGFCLNALEPVPKINVHPVVKVLFSANINDVQIEPRNVEEWVTKKQAQEVYLLPSQIKELIANLETAHSTYPPSQTFSQGFSVSSLKT